MLTQENLYMEDPPKDNGIVAIGKALEVFTVASSIMCQLSV